MQDPELVEKARQKIEENINGSTEDDWQRGKAIALEHLKYINEVAPEVKPTDEFKEAFKTATGTTMEEYKADVANKQKAPVVPGVTTFKPPTPAADDGSNESYIQCNLL